MSDKTNKLGLDQLLIYAAYCMEIKNKGTRFTFEDLVAECYRQFPDRFCLTGYPCWPDSARVNKCWLRCRTDRGWLTGNSKRGFKLTDAGRLVALEVQQNITGAKPSESLDKRTFKNKVENIRRSTGFREYQQGHSSISREHLIDSLGLPLEASRVRLREALRFAQRSAEIVNDEEVKAYLKVVEAGLQLQIQPHKKRSGQSPQ